MEYIDWINYRQGLIDYLVDDRSMSDLAKVRITHEVYMVGKILRGNDEYVKTHEAKAINKLNRALNNSQ